MEAWVEIELKSSSGNFSLIALVSLLDITLTVIISLNKRNRVFDAHGETSFAHLEISIYKSIVVTQCKFDGSLFYLYTVYQPLFIMFIILLLN